MKNVKNQKIFSTWFNMDSEIKSTSEGIDGTEGFVLRWESKVVGNGSQTITKITENDSVISSLKFDFREPAKGYFIFNEINSNQTSVIWGISGKSSYPFNIMNWFMDMNKDFEEGLQNLKETLE